MKFNAHSDLKDQHAFLSASKYHWVNYTDEKMEEVFMNYRAKERGTDLHKLAQELIRLKVKLPKNGETLSLYVNDAIGYIMTPEQVLFYSYFCFGTADAICFRKNLLRIHDLKTGENEANFTQLEVYAALFCLEYDVKPEDIKIELRIYQNNAVRIRESDPKDIRTLMNKILSSNKILERLRMEV